MNFAFSLSGAACFLFSSLIVMLLVVCKAYKSVLQRLFLYLMLATTVRELFLAASIEHHFKYEGQETVCSWIAFIHNWFGILLFVYTVGILIYLFFLVQYVAKGNTVPKLLQSKHRRIAFEFMYAVLSALVTLCYATMPLFTKKYGLAGGWCWIRALDKDCNLTAAGLVAQLLNGHLIYVSGGIIGVIMLVAIAVVYSRLPITLPEARLLLKKAFFILVSFLVYTIIVVSSLAIRMITAKSKTYQLPAIWITFGATYPVSLLFFPIAFLICFYSIRKACKACTDKLSSCCLQCFTKYRPIHHKKHVRFQQTTQPPTYPESTRISAPSSTFFHVPYTNDFTHITTARTSGSHVDTGYSSISQQYGSISQQYHDSTSQK